MPRFIEKIRVPVRLASIGAPPLAGRLSLMPLAELHEGPETLLERLNAPARVVPLEQASGEGVRLVMRQHIEWVEAGPEVEERLVRLAPFLTTREENVQVRLLGGGSIDGILSMEMPDEFNRASDFLNGPDDFFALRTATGTRLVHKACVVDVLLRVALAVPRAA
jgi:hypothetical protein